MEKETEQENKKSKKLSYILGAIFFLLFIYVIDWSFLRGQITEYSIMCPADFDGCYTLRYTTYKIDEKNQKVIYWTEGFPPSTVTDCSIISRKNWRCAYDDGSAEFGFSDGGYFNYSLSYSNDNSRELFEKMDEETHCVSRPVYLMFQWGLKKYL
jgi:hypothetical protein